MGVHSSLSGSARDQTTPRRWLSIIGIGEDGVAGLSAAARALIRQAGLVAGGQRHLALAADLIQAETLAWPSPIDAAFPSLLQRRGTPVVVLASGDPSHYGIGNQLTRLVTSDEILCLPQPSAFALAAARLGWPVQDVAQVSLHGRALAGIIRHLHPGARILALAWDGSTAAKLAALLDARGLGASRLTVLEAMGGVAERLRGATAAGFALTDIAALNTIAVEVAFGGGGYGPSLAAGLDDRDFDSDGQLTRREIRAIVLSALGPRPGELLWDIGLGAGSIAIEWLLRHPSMRAIGIEGVPERAARAARNAVTLGAADLHIVEGVAPAALAGLPVPDAIFIGGGVSEAGVLEAAWQALRPGGRMVANAVTLEGEARLLRAHAELGGDLTRIALAHADKVGTMHGWRPAMPVTHWRVAKPRGNAS